MEVCEADIRCLDAHAHFGNFVFDRRRKPFVITRRACGLANCHLGRTSRASPVGDVDNRPFLRCMHGHGEWSNNSDDCVGGGCPPRSHSPGEWNRCKQRPTETQVSNITHCGIGHFQAPNIARDTFLRCYSCAPPIRCLIFAGPTRSYAAWRS